MSSSVVKQSNDEDWQSPLQFAEASFCDITVHGMTLSGFQQALSTAILHGKKWLIAHHNLHSLYLWHREVPHDTNASLRRFYQQARWIQVDGMSMVLLARLHGLSIRRDHRIAYNQVLPSVLAEAEEKGWRVFYLGSSKEVSEAGGRALRDSFPKLELAVQHGYFSIDQSGHENQAVLSRIADFRTNLLFVGMGMPRQEKWVEENFEHIQANVVITSGATLDYFAGALPIPPQWMSRGGLEWVFRLATEPRRLGFRYLIDRWIIVLNLGKRRLFKKRMVSRAERQPISGEEPEGDLSSSGRLRPSRRT